MLKEDITQTRKQQELQNALLQLKNWQQVTYD